MPSYAFAVGNVRMYLRIGPKTRTTVMFCYVTRPTTAVSCPTALGTLCGQQTFRLARTPSSYSHRTFSAVGPRLWNSLPVQLRNPDITYGLFRRQLKGRLFREA